MGKVETSASGEMALVDRIRLMTGIGKDAFSLLRDAAVFVLVIVLATNAGLVKKWMTSNQVDRVNLGFIEWNAKASKEQAISAVNASAEAEKKAAESITKLEQIARANPDLAPQLAPVLASLRATATFAADANRTAASAAAKQEQLLPEVSGWVSSRFLRIDGEVAAGSRGTVIPPRPLNLRSAPGVGSGTMGTLAPGTRVRIVEGPTGTWVRVTTERTS